MKVYVVWCRDDIDPIAWISGVFSSKEKANEHVEKERDKDYIYSTTSMYIEEMELDKEEDSAE